MKKKSPNSAKAAARPIGRLPEQSEWIRLKEASVYCSLSVSELFRLCVAGEIESVHRTKPGSEKGIRLINRTSLDEYIRSYLPGGSRCNSNYVARKNKPMATE